MKRKQGFLKWAYHIAYSQPTMIKGTICAYHCDDIITFLDLTTNEHIIYHAFGGDTGDGISCISGHNVYPIFAFAESKYYSNIYIMLYPSMEKIKVLQTNHISKYISIRFTESEYLLCLTGYPNFTIVVWNYRKGIIMGEYPTGINVERQSLICGVNANLCAQYSSVSNEINIWELNTSGDKVFFIKKNIKLTFVRAECSSSATFGVDGNLYLIDSDGNFFLINSSTCIAKKIWAWNEKIVESQNWHIHFYKGGFIIVGSDNRLKFLKKDKTWNVIFTMKLNEPVRWLKTVNNFEKIYLLTFDRCLSLLIDDLESPTLKFVAHTGPYVKSFAIINPFGKYCAILTEINEIRIIDISCGTKMSQMSVRTAIFFKSYPKLPILVVGCSDGTVILISCVDPKTLNILTDFKLNSYPIKDILFTEHYMITFDASKTFFIIKGQPGGELKVVKFFQITYDIYKVVVIEKTSKSLAFYIIPWENRELPMELVIVTYENGEISELKCSLKFQIVDIIALESHLLAARLGFNEIYELFVKGEIITFNLWQKTAHHIKYVKMYGLENSIMSWSLDGIVALYSFDNKTLNYTFSVQNRRNELDYITVAQCTSNQKRCIVLTKRGTLKSYTTKEKIAEISYMGKLDMYFNSATTSPYRSISGRSWIEEMSYEKLQQEKAKFAGQKANVMKIFKIIKKKLNSLVDENLALEDPEDRVPLSSLNLAKEYAQSIVDKARKNREAEDKILKQFIADQNRITFLILSETWSNMLTKNQKIFGIFTYLACENYALSQFDLRNFRNIETKLKIHRTGEISADVWHPYLPPWDKNSTIEIKDKRKSIVLVRETGEQYVSEIEIDLAEVYALSGTATHLFVTPHSAQYHQFEVVTYSQMFIQEFLVAFDVRELKQSFNKNFEAMIKTKADTMKYVKTRNERFREIQSEMNALAVLRGDDTNYTTYIEDPELAPQETPESITKVEKWEVKVKPYISPSEQRILDDIAYKEELRRLALLADDFRERALIVMMDGVLEKRWEDEIKKDVPKPDCLLKGKDPSEYTKEDLKAINDYEEKVKFICSERERYRVMLTDEEKKLQSVQDDNILKFNLKCGELFLQKLNYDAAVKHEELKLLRTSLFNFKRMKFKQREQILNCQLLEKRQKVEELTDIITIIEKRVLESQQKYEQLQNRDKGLEKSFKLQFGESVQAFVVDTAFKLFRRRPKWQQKGWATPTLYVEIANIIGNKNTSKVNFPLPDECYEYLNLIENNDNYSQAPNIIDQKVWEVLCRLRRSKIESEFRLKALGLQLAETEATHSIFLKDISVIKITISSLEKELHDLNFAYEEFIKNRTVQIVMPMGLVEVSLSGLIPDTQGSLLLSRTDIADINAIIKRAGEKKLKTMQRLAVFRRRVLMKEWEHKALQMSVQDLKDFLNVIEHTNVTFEMRQWLREKAENRVVEITNAYLSRKIEAKLTYFNNALREIEENIEECIAKIQDQKVENTKLDTHIKLLNVDVTERNLSRDMFFEEKLRREQKEIMAICMERSRLIRRVQSGHLQLLELATLLELQKLKTFPTLNPLMKNLCAIANKQ